MKVIQVLFFLITPFLLPAQVELWVSAPNEIQTWDSIQALQNPIFKTQQEIPDSVFVKNLKEGYNSTSCNGEGYTGMIDFDSYIAGVISREMGGSFPLEALKAQAVAARSYSYARHLQGLPVNCGQAYTESQAQSCIQASRTTSKQLILYNDAPVVVNYSARCNGDFTQNSEEGNWNGPSCGGNGNIVPYQREVECAGHIDCTQLNEPYCCTIYTASANTNRSIYGHGVGMCQRGAQTFANEGMNYQEILLQFYTDIKLSDSIPTIPNDTSQVDSNTIEIELRKEIQNRNSPLSILIKNSKVDNISISVFSINGQLLFKTSSSVLDSTALISHPLLTHQGSYIIRVKVEESYLFKILMIP